MNVEISVVVTSYSTEDYHYLKDCIESILCQTFENFELIIVTENDDLKKMVSEDFDDKRIKIVDFEGSGVAEARNVGASVAKGDILSFTDDDAIVEEEWLEKIKNTYETTDCVGVSGKILPMDDEKWVRKIPEEFLWLVGLTQRGYGKKGETVRNAYGPNMSFRKKDFDELGGFDKKMGKIKSFMMQGEESEFSSRLRQKKGKGVIYEPDIKVYHHVEKSQTSIKNLSKRAFYHGYSKGYMSESTFENNLEEEEVIFLKKLVFNFLPEHLTNINLRKLALSLIFSICVSVGFIYYKFASYI